VLAQEEARSLKHNYIGTEHLLLGLLREEEGLGARVLESLQVSVEEVRAQVARIVGQGEEVMTGQIPFTPRAKRVLELALREALSLGHNYIGTEHVLLGLARENEGVAARILLDFEADAEKIRNEVVGMLLDVGQEHEPWIPKSPPLAPEFLQELERVRREKETAIENQEFEKGAALGDRERRLHRAARRLERAWEGLPEPPPPRTHPRRSFPMRPMPTRVADYPAPSSVRPAIVGLLVGWVMFGAAAGIGLLVGWLIWG
jgi:hypothetical protein